MREKVVQSGAEDSYILESIGRHHLDTLTVVDPRESLVLADSAHPPAGDGSKYEGTDVEKGVDAGYCKIMT